jgi:DNA polymerase-3 subunit beta
LIVNAQRKELLMQVRKAARAAAAIHPVKELSGILLEADERTGVVRMTATDLTAAIRSTLPAAVEKAGSAVVDARLFQDLLDKLPGDDVYMELKGNGQLYISGETARFHISVMPGANYPKVDIPYPGDTVSVTGLKALVNRALFAAAADTQKAVYNCLNFMIGENGLRAVGCNGYCTVQVKGDPECRGNISLLIPASSLKLLSAIAGDSDVFELGVTGSGGVSKNAVFSDGTTLFSTRLIEGVFVDTDKLFADVAPVSSARLSADQLRAALDQLSGVSSQQDTVAITVESGRLGLSCETDCGAAAAHIAAVIDRSTDETYYYTIKNLLGCARTLKGSVTFCFTKNKALAVYGGDVRYLQLGVRPREKAKPKKAAREEAAA